MKEYLSESSSEESESDESHSGSEKASNNDIFLNI
jgi:hypothetical protein